MEITIFFVGSVTGAMRGKRLLEQQGFRAFIQRTSEQREQNGCGYSLKVFGDPNKARQLLQRAGIRLNGEKRGGSA